MTDNPDNPEPRPARRGRRRSRGVHPRRAGRVRPAARPDRDVPPLVRRRARGRAARAQRHGRRDRLRRTSRRAARLVLLKGVSEEGFVFYTNTGSRKGTELAGNPRIALLFPWHPLERQVRVDGTAALLPRAEVDAYFAVRPRGSQLGAWASHQSSVVSGREELLGGVRRRGAALRRRRGADPRGVGRLPRAPGVGGVLAGPAGPDARPAGLPAYAGRLAHRAAGPLDSPRMAHMAHTDHGPRGAGRHSVDRS